MVPTPEDGSLIDDPGAVSIPTPAIPRGHAAPDALLVAFSGGLDSTALLHLLAQEFPDRVRALHVHHGLQAEADAWASHCEAFCSALHVPLQVVRAQVETDSGSGPEAAARHARHVAFREHLRPGEWLVLAHHLEDQAETFLLRALRASGPDGLAAMRPLREFGAGMMWRPLLDVSRSALRDHAERHRLAWIEDPSNDSLDFDRNFLRHEVMPLLRGRWRHADAAFARSAALAGEAATLLAESDVPDLARVRSPADAADLDATALRALAPARRARVLRAWVAAAGLPPLPAAAHAIIDRELLQSRFDAEPCHEWHGARIERWRDRLHLGRAIPTPDPDWSRRWDGSAPIVLPGGGRLVLAGSPGFGKMLEVRHRRGGERIRLPGRVHSSLLRNLLQEGEMPPWRRRQMPLLFDPDDDCLVAAGDSLLAARFAAIAGAADARLEWQLA